MSLKRLSVCRYCGGVIRLVPAESIFGKRTKRLCMEGEKVYQCQNCNARVCCHKGTTRPLGNVANEVLRLKRIEAHEAFDTLWHGWHISRTQAYKWLSQQLRIPVDKTHIGGFEMDECQRVIELCGKAEDGAA